MDFYGWCAWVLRVAVIVCIFFHGCWMVLSVGVHVKVGAHDSLLEWVDFYGWWAWFYVGMHRSLRVGVCMDLYGWCSWIFMAGVTHGFLRMVCMDFSGEMVATIGLHGVWLTAGILDFFFVCMGLRRWLGVHDHFGLVCIEFSLASRAYKEAGVDIYF